MKKLIFLGFFLFFLFVGLNFVLSDEGKSDSEKITFEELGIDPPRFLPGNFFYFFKRIKNSGQAFFSFGNLNKAKTSLSFLTDKSAIIKTLIEKNSDRKVIDNAITGYKDNLDNFENRLFLLNGSSPQKVNALLDELAEQFLKQEVLLESLGNEFPDFAGDLDKLKSKLEEVSAWAFNNLDLPDNFEGHFKNINWGAKESLLRELLIIKALSVLEEKITEDKKDSFIKIENDLVLGFEGSLKALGEDKISDFLKLLESEGFLNILTVFDQVRELLNDQNLRSRFNEFRQKVLSSFSGDNLNLEESSRKIINSVELDIKKTEEEVDFSKYSPQDPLKQLFEKAKLNLEQSQKLYANSDYLESFSQGSASRASLKNFLFGLRIGSGELTAENLNLRIVFDDLKNKAKSKNYNAEGYPNLYELFNRAEKILVAKPSISSIKEAKIILGEIEALIE